MLKELINKHIQIIKYLIFGALTTVVSILSYYLCTKFFLSPKVPLELQVANIVSWILSVTFAYATNKLFVFESHGEILKEALKFYCSRLGTLGCEIALMYVLVTIMKFHDLPVKILVQFVVIVANYIISKFLIFKVKK